jgi:hypothetical protein
VRKLGIFLLIGLISCSYFKKKSDRAVARVYDEYLYESDLNGLILPGTPVADSLDLTRNYIDSWIRQRLLLLHAETNLPEEKKDFSAQLEDYRNSLVIYTYENALVTQKLDTAVTNKDIEAYYTANRQNFLLKENIVRLNYVRFPRDMKNLNQARRWFYSGDEKDRERLAGLCDVHAMDVLLDSGQWLYFNNVLEVIPINTYNQEEFLRNRRTLEIEDSISVFLVKFLDFRITSGVSPLQFEKARIRSIIMNKRKLDLISRMQQDVYISAMKANAFEVY